MVFYLKGEYPITIQCFVVLILESIVEILRVKESNFCSSNEHHAWL